MPKFIFLLDEFLLTSWSHAQAELMIWYNPNISVQNWDRKFNYITSKEYQDLLTKNYWNSLDSHTNGIVF